MHQEKKVVKVVGTFNGYNAEDGYAFLIKDEEDGEEAIYFIEITDEVLKAVNIKSKDMIGKRFEITCQVTEYEEDENGFVETFESFKIVQLKKV